MMDANANFSKLYHTGIETTLKPFSKIRLGTLNCTTLELKPRQQTWANLGSNALNCTTLELKRDKKITSQLFEVSKLYHTGIETVKRRGKRCRGTQL